MATRTLLTLEDILALPDRDDCRYEVEDGELIEVALPRPKHQVATINLAGELFIYLRASPIGRLYPSDTPFLLKTDPITLRGPDAAVILNANLGKVHSEDIIQGAPDLAIEVASPSNRASALLRRVTEFLEAGAAEVWLVYPDAREVHIYSQTEPLRLLRETDFLTSETLLPGFSMPVASIFA
jgi:Uma2 family endonuclease